MCMDVVANYLHDASDTLASLDVSGVARGGSEAAAPPPSREP